MASNDDQPSAGQEPDSPQWQQHEYVERFKPDPSQPTALVRSFVGLPGNSDRPGYQRLYLTRSSDYYVEFLAEAVVFTNRCQPNVHPSRVWTRPG